MKRFFALMFVTFAVSFSVWAYDPDSFISEFEDFVTDVVNTDNDELVGTELTNIEKQYNKYIKEYERTEKKEMTTRQIEKFTKLRAKYKKKVLAAKAKRKGAAVKGWVKGLMNHDDDD